MIKNIFIKIIKENNDFKQEELDILNNLVEEKFLKKSDGKYFKNNKKSKIMLNNMTKSAKTV